jgi:hypothetical protein
VSLAAAAAGPSGGLIPAARWIAEDARLDGLFARLEACSLTEEWEVRDPVIHRYRASYPAVDPIELARRVESVARAVGAEAFRRTVPVEGGEMEFGVAQRVRGTREHPTLVFLHEGDTLAVYAEHEPQVGSAVRREVARQAETEWLSSETPRQARWTRGPSAPLTLAASYTTVEAIDGEWISDGRTRRRLMGAAAADGFGRRGDQLVRTRDDRRVVLDFEDGLALTMTVRTWVPAGAACATRAAAGGQ